MYPITRRSFVVALATAAIAIPASTADAAVAARPAVPPPSPDLPPYEQWIADVTAVTRKASAYLANRLANGGEGTAIVLDVDNTALESAYYDGPGPTSRTEPVYDVAIQAYEAGAAVFFVTARGRSWEERTLENLEDAGYPVAGLYTHDSGDGLSLAAYKTSCRVAIEEQGYVIVANIGNLNTDLSGGHAERTFKLPDYDGLLG